MNDSSIYSVERGDLVRVTVDSGENVTGEVMENSTYESPTGSTKQSIIIKSVNDEVYSLEKIEKGSETEERPLSGSEFEGFVTELEGVTESELRTVRDSTNDSI